MTRSRSPSTAGRAEAEVTPRTHLADFLREHLLLTGTHIGCEHGICGACTVEIDGEIARSCITYAVACDGADVRTIEGFDDDALMARLRQAFTEEHALQCGYCTPGMLVAARDLVRRKHGAVAGGHPHRDERQSLPLHGLHGHRQRHRARDDRRDDRSATGRVASARLARAGTGAAGRTPHRPRRSPARARRPGGRQHRRPRSRHATPRPGAPAYLSPPARWRSRTASRA